MLLRPIQMMFSALPPNVATDEHRTLAKAMLKVKGVNFTKPGTTVRLTPPRR